MNIEIQYIATICFAAAVVHTFLTKQFIKLAERHEKGAVLHELLHFLGEVEVVFGIWAGIFIIFFSVIEGIDAAVAYTETVTFTEALFVFVIMCMAATSPVMSVARRCISFPARFSERYKSPILYMSCLIVGPLLGSLITEPAAMTVTALLLKEYFLDDELPMTFEYATTGLLFVNISVGGVLTHFAAPPVVMVAEPWGWDLAFMAQNFGWKAIIVVMVSTIFTTAVFWNVLMGIKQKTPKKSSRASRPPLWLSFSHLGLMALVVLYHSKPSFFVPLFLMFVGWYEVTRRYQEPLKLRQSLLVGFFLGGLVTLGKLQGWWLSPLITSMGENALFVSAIALTAVTDNAALTYLGTLVPNLSPVAKYLLVAGAVTGGGLTVIANAPNPIGYGILRKSLDKDSGISPLGLFAGALPYTIFAALVFYFL